MGRFLYAILLGIVGAAIVHIAIMLLLPIYSDRDAWSRISTAADLHSFIRVGRQGASPYLVKPADPLIAVAACRFDLSDGVVHVHAPGQVPFWSISVYDRRGANVYSFSDRTAVQGLLDVVLATPVQAIELRKALPPEFANSVIIESDTERGIVALRSFVPDPSWEPTVSSYLAGAVCELAGD